MTTARRKTKRTPVREPQQARAVQTRERLLDVAGELLADVGIERISTNMICAHAGVTPPTLYRYFKDKYAVLEALGQRLMDRQNAVLLAWLDKHKDGGAAAYAEHVEDLLRDTAKITASEPGGIWIERALRAVPQLAHVRINSHRSVTDAMLEVYAPLLPEMDRDLLWRRIRLSVEYGYATDEMLNEEDLIPRDEILREAARLLRWSLRDADT
jgi:AcrR family transcriptional regulator